MSSFMPCETADPARWVIDRVVGFAERVTSIVPGGFEAYVRIMHPFRVWDGPDLSWTELAHRLGREPHPLMQEERLTAGFDYAYLRQFYDSEPLEGEISREIAAVVAEVLGRHTATPGECYFAVWEGFPNLEPEHGLGVAFELPHRRYHLHRAPVSAATEEFETGRGQRSNWIFFGREPTDEEFAQLRGLGGYPPNLWWPADQAWCVATGIDFAWTFVGCSRAAADELVGSELEAFHVRADDPVTMDSGPVYE